MEIVTVREKREKTLADKLFEDRILFAAAITPDTARDLYMRMLYLESQDPSQDVYLFIDSPGGFVSSGLALYDVMRFITCDVWTIALGMAASQGAFLLAGGTKGKRVSLPNSQIMIHQPLQEFGGLSLQATELQIAAKEIMRTRQRLNQILSQNTGQTIERIEADTERDLWMSAEEAFAYGLIDVIAESRQDISSLIKRFKESEAGRA